MSRKKGKQKQSEQREETPNAGVNRGNAMRYVIGIAAIVVIIAFFATRFQPKQPYSFASGIADVRKIDFSHGTSYHSEMLNKSVVPLEKIDPLIADFDRLATKIRAQPQTEDTALLLKFIDARKEMLESQRYYELTFSYGKEGDIWDGFTCKEIPQLLNVSALFNKSIEHGVRATMLMDAVLTQMYTRTLIGTGETKPEFYYSPFAFYAKTMRSINMSIDVYCHGAPLPANQGIVIKKGDQETVAPAHPAAHITVVK